ncbi:hypothetical protein AC1031_003707 [Aphanomyces cochlioides]|nr:hypothetical protein AC1031_003707 [Aphanomyces cochlioides]
MSPTVAQTKRISRLERRKSESVAEKTRFLLVPRVTAQNSNEESSEQVPNDYYSDGMNAKSGDDLRIESAPKESETVLSELDSDEEKTDFSQLDPREVSIQQAAEVCDHMRGLGMEVVPGLENYIRNQLLKSKTGQKFSKSKWEETSNRSIDQKTAQSSSGPDKSDATTSPLLAQRRSSRLNGGSPPPSDHGSSDSNSWNEQSSDVDESGSDIDSADSLSGRPDHSTTDRSGTMRIKTDPRERERDEILDVDVESDDGEMKKISFTNPFKILPFDGKDWSTYREDIRAVAIRQGVWKILCDEEKAPDSARFPRKYALYLKRQAIANELLVTSLDKSSKVVVSDMETVQEKFKWLERQHAKRPFMNKMEGKARLIEYHFDHHRETIHQYLINFAKKKHDLLSMGKGLSVDEEREILLCNTRKYLNFRNTRTREMHGNLERVNLKFISRRLNGDRKEALGIINEIVHGVKRPVIGVMHQKLNVLDVVAWAIIKVIVQEAA